MNVKSDVLLPKKYFPHTIYFHIIPIYLLLVLIVTYILSLVCFVRMDYTEQYHIECNSCNVISRIVCKLRI